MMHLKTAQDIAIMAQGGHMLAKALQTTLRHAKPGISELTLDAIAEEEIKKAGGTPGFKKVPGYNHTICISVNDVVVHGVPTAYRLCVDDVVGIDCGVYFGGFYTDMSETLRVKTQNASIRQAQDKNLKAQKQDKIDTFLRTGKRALGEAIKVSVVGNRVGDISKTIQEIVERSGYSIVRSLVGHGVGKNLHEEPEVPGFLSGSVAKTPLLREGMTIAIEVIYNMGKSKVTYSNHDGWTIRTADKSVSGLFERTVAITKNSPVVLTA